MVHCNKDKNKFNRIAEIKGNTLLLCAKYELYIKTLAYGIYIYVFFSVLELKELLFDVCFLFEHLSVHIKLICTYTSVLSWLQSQLFWHLFPHLSCGQPRSLQFAPFQPLEHMHLPLTFEHFAPFKQVHFFKQLSP